MNLERFMYEFNLISTLTITDTIEWAYVLNHNIDKCVDYSNSICFYDLVKYFNDGYLLFSKDYEKLPKLILGSDIEIWDYCNSNDEKNQEMMLISIGKPIEDINNDYGVVLYLYIDNEKKHCYVTNGLNFFHDDYFKKDVILEDKIIKEYLNFGKKYKSLIDSYFFLQNKFILGNGCTALFSKIKGILFTNLETFEISFGNAYFNSEDYINIVFNLGENLSIDYDKSKVIFGLEEKNNKKEIIDLLIYKLFINIDKLTDMYKNNNVKKLVR